ncbi:MAG: arylsulfatase [Synoicihabitans sp.]
MGATLVFAADSRPNIILIVADDLGYSDIGSFGGEIETPHLDQLAREGMRFTQFYNCGVCVTTRSGMYTGLYPRFPGRASAANSALRPEMTTLGSVLKAAGYQTAMTGKWHLGHEAPLRPIDCGFDEFYGLLDGCCNFFNPAQPDPDFYNGGVVRHFAHNEEPVTSFPKDYYSTIAFTDHAIEMIERFAESDSPFFINLNYTAPHFPLHALPEDIERYRGKYRRGYERMRRDRYARQNQAGLFDPDTVWLSPADAKESDFRYDNDIVPWDELDPVTRRREEERMEVYAAMVDRMDRGIGRVLRALENSGEADNTLVIFFSDNGGCASWPTDETVPDFEAYNRGIPVGDGRGYEFVGKAWGWAQNAPFRRHKVWTYEGGIATPMIVRWPQAVRAGTVTRAPGHVVDLMPTFVELADATYPTEREGYAVPPMEGQTLTPLLRGETRPSPDMGWALFSNYAWREGDRKIVFNVSRQEWELYDLSIDRSETRNLAPLHTAEVDRMVGSFLQWAERCGITEL